MATDTAKPWRTYAVGAPPFVNTLTQLEFSKAYWIRVHNTATLHLKPGPRLNPAQAGFGPPATYYGAVLPSDQLTPTAGMTVTAWINGQSCGQTQTLVSNLHGRPQVVYAINVFAENPAQPNGCGMPGKTITFTLNGQKVAPSALWNPEAAWELTLNADSQLFLPAIFRK